MDLTRIKRIFARMVAVFVERGLDVLGAGALAGVAVFQSVFMAGILGIAVVLKSLARAYIVDGHISDADEEEAFKEALKPAKKK